MSDSEKILENMEVISNLMREIKEKCQEISTLSQHASLKEGIHLKSKIKKWNNLLTNLAEESPDLIQLTFDNLYDNLTEALVAEVKINELVIEFYKIVETDIRQLEMEREDDKKHVKIIFVEDRENLIIENFPTSKFQGDFFLIDSKVEKKVTEFLMTLNMKYSGESKTNFLLEWMEENLKEDDWFYYE